MPNLFLSLRKSSQDISESTCKWIPLPPLNKEWTNEKIYEYFKLSKDEIKLIKDTKIVGYKDEIDGKNNTEDKIPSKKIIKKKEIIKDDSDTETESEEPQELPKKIYKKVTFVKTVKK